MKMRCLVKTLALCSALALAAGCVTYKQHVTFENDGSGRLVMDVWMPYFGIEATGPETDAKLTAALDQQMDEVLANMEGVRLEENWSRLESEGDKRIEHMHVAVAFDDVSKLSAPDLFQNQAITFENTGDGFLFKQVMRKEQEEAAEESLDPEYEELAQALFEGQTFTYTVVMPGRVIDSNGTVGEDGRTVTWEWPLSDFVKTEQVEMTAKAAGE